MIGRSPTWAAAPRISTPTILFRHSKIRLAFRPFPGMNRPASGRRSLRLPFFAAPRIRPIPRPHRQQKNRDPKVRTAVIIPI